ncbi:MAG: response regulator [Desulfonatronovibrio sp.]
MFSNEQSVLVVDDIGPSRQTVINVLRVLGYRKILEAGNGHEALEYLNSKKDVGLVISDWKMPVMNGIELLDKIRSRNEWSNLPFLLVTSKGEVEDVALASDMGATGFMVKPLNIKAFQGKLNSLTRNSPAAALKKVLDQNKKAIHNDNFGEAIRNLLLFLEDYPEFESRIHLEIGLLMEQEARWDDAEKMADKALKENPSLARACFLKARMQGMQDNWEKAVESIQKAIDISPKNVDYRLFKGEALLKLNKLVNARASYMTAVNTFPKDQKLKQIIWNTYLEHGLVDQVMNDFGAIMFGSLTADTLNKLGIALRKAGSFKDALRVYKQALIKDKDNPAILYNAAMAQARAGSPAVAVKYLKRAIEIEPDFNEADALLTRLTEKYEL